MSNTRTVVSTQQLKDALPKFPVERERQQFPNWIFKVESFLAARNMLDVVKKPIVNMASNEEIVIAANEDEHDVYLGVDLGEREMAALISKSMQAYDYIVQSLHTKQVDLIRGISTGNAYMVWKKLKKSYGIIKSTTTIMTLLSKLNMNRKLPTETMNDYFARIDRIISDLRVLDATVIFESMKKYFILNGLTEDSEYKLIVSLIYQLDVDNDWPTEKLEQYLIDQEDKKLIQKSQHIEVNDDVTTDDETKALSSQQVFRSGYRRGRGRSSFRGRGTHHHNNRRFENSSPTPHKNGSANYLSRRGTFRGRGRFQFPQRKSNVKCYTCQKIGHTSSQCRNNPLANVQCHSCQRYGHISSNCFQNHRKRHNDANDDQYDSTSSSSSSLASSDTSESKKQRTLAYVVISNPSSDTAMALQAMSSFSNDWILDGGATDHYVSNVNMLHDM